MKRILIILTIIIFTATSYCSARSYYTPAVSNGIRLYKAKNYTECLQVLYDAVNKDPSNVLGYYYIAIAHAKLGDTAKANDAYQRVIDLNTSTQLTKYAMNGMACLSDPSKCPTGSAAYNFSKQSNEAIEKEMADRRIDSIKNMVNSKNNVQDVPVEYLRDLKDYSQPKNQIQNKTSEVPTKEEIADAFDTLRRAGYQPFSPQQGAMTNEMMQMNMLNSLVGDNQNNSNSMMALLPYMMNNSQNSDKKIAPEVVQTMMMNSLMGGLYDDFNKK